MAKSVTGLDGNEALSALSGELSRIVSSLHFIEAKVLALVSEIAVRLDSLEAEELPHG